MAAKKVTKDSLRAVLTNDGAYNIKLSKQPLVGKILTAKVILFQTNHKAQKMVRKINSFPDYIKYPPKDVTPTPEVLEEHEEFKKLLKQFETESERKPKVSEKTVRLRVVGIRKEGNAYVCTCNIV